MSVSDVGQARLYLFDDRRARDFEPLSLTRPLGEVLHGCLLQRERAERWAGTPCRGHLSDPSLLGFAEGEAPPVVLPESVPEEEPRILLSSRLVPGGDVREEIRDAALSGKASTLRLDGRPVGWVLPAGHPLPSAKVLLDPEAEWEAGAEGQAGADGEAEADGEAGAEGEAGAKGGSVPSGDGIAVEGALLESPWGLVERNAERIVRDVDLLHPRNDAYLPHGVERRGTGIVSLGDGVEIEPGVILDVTAGPIHLGAGVVVRGPARLEGPIFVGPGTTLLGGSYTAVSIGPVCKIRGEIEASVVLGYANKAHDGYIGHALLGRWTNLGALTTNSDLKNNYSAVRVTTSRGEVDTGLLKVGCFLGDHVKTGIGTLLNTGTVVGAGSNLFGGRMPPKYVPPFSWGAGDELVEFRLEKFLEVARAAMDRRGISLDDGMEALLRRAWEGSRDERSSPGPGA